MAPVSSTVLCFLAVIAGVAVIVLSAVFDWNRYSGLCGSFNDSTGGYRNGKYRCWTPNQSHKISQGKRDGPIGIERSGAVWIYFSILYVFVTVLHVSTLIYRLENRRRKDKAIGQSGSDSLGVSAKILDSHLAELYRVCWIVFFCTTVLFLFECIEVAKTVICKRRIGERLYHTLGGISFLAQGSQLMFEIRYKRESHEGIPKWLRPIFIFFAIYNVVHWGDTIANTVCKFDRDNGAVIGKEAWTMVRPLLRSSIVFFRILSACLYWILAVSQHGQQRQQLRSRDRAAEQLKTKVCGISELMCGIAAANPSPFRPIHRRVREQTIQCVRHENLVRFSYKIVTSKQLRLADTMYVLSFPAIAIVSVPPFVYGIMTSDDDTSGIVRYRFILELILAASILVISLCLLFVVPEFQRTKSRSERSYSTTNNDSFESGLSRYELVKAWIVGKTWLFNAEAMTVSIFGIATVLFHTIALVRFARSEENTPVSNAVMAAMSVAASFAQLLVIIVIKFRNKFAVARVRRYAFWVVSATGLLFCLSLSSLVIGIQREEFDEGIHKFVPLHILIPLVVDFRVHACILNFSMMTDFLEHRYPKGIDYRDLGRNSGEELILDQTRMPPCAGPGCGRPIYPGPEYHMTCSEVGCEKRFCHDCCDVVISQTGTCTCIFES